MGIQVKDYSIIQTKTIINTKELWNTGAITISSKKGMGLLQGHCVGIDDSKSNILTFVHIQKHGFKSILLTGTLSAFH